jgi:hypothetical protein
LLRSLLEPLATVLYLRTTPTGLQKFEDGKLEPKTVLACAKKVLPFYGTIYGILSEDFVHINQLHGELQPLMPYNESHSQALNANIRYLRFSVWLLFVVTEFTFYDLINGKKYWKEVKPGQVAFNPSAETLAWQKKFLLGDIGAVGEQTASKEG